MLTKVLLAATAALSLTSLAYAGSSATLHIGSGYGTPCATGGCPLYNGEVNNFNATLDIYQNATSAPDLTSPVYLILGVANSGSSASQVITQSIQNATLYNTSGQSSSVSTTFKDYAGLMINSNVYRFLGLAGNASNSFTNWSAADLSVDGITVKNFGIYVFSLNTNQFGANDYLNINTHLLPEGTFAVAYGVAPNNQTYSTPFTNSGMRDTPPKHVPEPTPLILLSIGALGLASLRRSRQGV